MSMHLNDETADRTAEAFDAPRVGDRFQEMYTFWLYVVAIEPKVVVLRGSAPITFPDGAERVEYDTVEDFRKAYAYGSIPGYWVRLTDRDNDVTGWDR
jgi:hypothetical protein